MVVALAVLFRADIRGFHWAVFLNTLAGLDLWWLLAAAALALATYYGRARRWAVLLRPVKPRPCMWNLVSATVIGFTAVTVLGRPGEFVRPYLIARKERVPVSSQLAAWLLERIFDLLVALLVFGWALGRVKDSGVAAGPALTWVLAVGGRFVAFFCLVSLLVLVLIRHFSEKMQNRLLDALRILPEARFARVEKLVRAFVQGVESTRSHHGILLLTFYTLLEWMLIAACYLCIARAYGNILRFGWVDILIFMGFVAFGSIVQIPGVGGGIQVVSVLVLRELFAVPLEVATSVALVVWLLTFIVVVPPGLLLAVREGLQWSRLKSLEEEIAP